jgi:hypothetical protein
MNRRLLNPDVHYIKCSQRFYNLLLTYVVGKLKPGEKPFQGRVRVSVDRRLPVEISYRFFNKYNEVICEG